MNAHSVVNALQGVVTGAALGTGLLIHQCLSAEDVRRNPPPVESTLTPCELHDGWLVCGDGSSMPDPHGSR